MEELPRNKGLRRLVKKRLSNIVLIIMGTAHERLISLSGYDLTTRRKRAEDASVFRGTNAHVHVMEVTLDI